MGELRMSVKERIWLEALSRVKRGELSVVCGGGADGAVTKELSAELIGAHSPRAKGRVERMNGTLQDRLVKEMRLRDVGSIG
jgi:hypothetical protein